MEALVFLAFVFFSGIFLFVVYSTNKRKRFGMLQGGNDMRIERVVDLVKADGKDMAAVFMEKDSQLFLPGIPIFLFFMFFYILFVSPFNFCQGSRACPLFINREICLGCDGGCM